METDTKTADLLSSDAALLQGYRQGDAAAMTRVYYAYVYDIIEFLRRGFAFDAGGKRYFFSGYSEPWHLESRIQEVFIKAFSERARLAYDGTRPFFNYLIRIARNSVMDDFRSRRRDALQISEQADADEISETPGPHSDDPEQALKDKELTAIVQRFRAELDDSSKALFAVRFTDGSSVETSAATLGWSEYRVKREEKRIRKRFFSFLKTHGYLEGYRLIGPNVESALVCILLIGARSLS